MELDGKVCVITGGAGSIGLAAARLFVAEGARVMLADLDETALRSAVAELGADRAGWQVADAADEEQIAACFDAARNRWGGVDVVLANAGITGTIAPVTEYPADEFDRVYRVHVRGAFLTCKHGLRTMHDGGSVIIVSSVAGLRGDPGVSAYITAKHAQIGLMRSVAKEAAERGIRVNTLHPGPVDNGFQHGLEDRLGKVLGTDATAFFDRQIPLGRHAAPTEIARSLLYLASAQSSFTTGSTLVVDGGMSG
ncbi:SDR family NAD(P)-dependent oxidoreductase [Amycolatopsis anabasis]|uniref:SDR family NAD(P)-dependent oxidoreductase n=1 Tax=Amycolatopsis anabasis TaxID=1840409 RepID=UPI00131D1A0A|nr:SDR family NAD(P)-dependent oxidoreductase [Amycolatopsis anabasis]